MDVDMIFRIAAIGILVAVLNQVLSRAGRDEQAMMTTLAGLVVVLMMVVQRSLICLPWSKLCFSYDRGDDQGSRRSGDRRCVCHGGTPGHAGAWVFAGAGGRNLGAVDGG